MILVDFSQFAITSVLINAKQDAIHEDMIRHLILNQIRKNRSKFFREYGELVLAIDDTGQWRKDVFKYYKAQRRKNRAKSPLDWSEIFRILDKLLTEFKETFPYKIIRVSGAEGDDVIATLARHFTTEKVLILSSDKDFQQLQKFSHIKQYDPFRSKWIKSDNPHNTLREHIIRGDQADGIPNFLSHDDVFVNENLKQKSITQKRLEEWLSLSEDEFYRTISEDQRSHYMRNKMMIDFDMIPDNIQESIIEEYHKPIQGHRSKIMTYFIKHRMKMLMESLQDF